MADRKENVDAMGSKTVLIESKGTLAVWTIVLYEEAVDLVERLKSLGQDMQAITSNVLETESFGVLEETVGRCGKR